MKLALLLFGIHSLKYHYNPHKLVDINYKYSLDNYKKYIFNFFESKGYEIDVFISTYSKSYNQDKDLLADYKPKSYKFLPMESNRIRGRNRHFRTVLSLCLDYSKTNKMVYDTVLITHFDLIFQDDFGKSNINYNTLNLVSILQHPRYVCDNFYLLPFKFLEKLNDAVKSQNLGMIFHRLGPVFEKFLGPINYIKNEK